MGVRVTPVIDGAVWVAVLDCLSDAWRFVPNSSPLQIHREGTRERLTIREAESAGITRWEISGPGTNSVIQLRTGNPPNAIAHAIELRLLPKVRAYLAANPETAGSYPPS